MKRRNSDELDVDGLRRLVVGLPRLRDRGLLRLGACVGPAVLWILIAFFSIATVICSSVCAAA